MLNLLQEYVVDKNEGKAFFEVEFLSVLNVHFISTVAEGVTVTSDRGRNSTDYRERDGTST